MKTKENKPKPEKEKSSASNKVLTIVGIILCVIFIPILIINVTMIIKGFVKKDEVPTIGGYAPLIVLTDSMNPPTTEEFKSIFPIDMTFTDSSKAGIKTVTNNITVNRTSKVRKIEVTIGDNKETVKKIRSGDLIIIKKIKAEDVKVGDVISFFDPSSSGNAVVTHRVVALEYDEATGELVSFRTRGDSNNSNDKESVPVNNLVGIWTGTVLDGVGKVAMFLQSTPGLIICIAVPVLILVGYELIVRRKDDKAKQKDTDALMKELEELRKIKEQHENKDDSQQEPNAESDADPDDETINKE